MHTPTRHRRTIGGQMEFSVSTLLIRLLLFRVNADECEHAEWKQSFLLVSRWIPGHLGSGRGDLLCVWRGSGTCISYLMAGRARLSVRPRALYHLLTTYIQTGHCITNL
ncbi:hypothetical protein FQA47_017490 [Oryzias melastigma]|uniref:Secreted protein n=1 Tax=Oryzias melastigma TaxID=30732 RepID=A0A834FLX6_ORYME|nr:hypothetical protein FQA47_017490 [Oryzias melastigma]